MEVLGIGGPIPNASALPHGPLTGSRVTARFVFLFCVLCGVACLCGFLGFALRLWLQNEVPVLCSTMRLGVCVAPHFPWFWRIRESKDCCHQISSGTTMLGNQFFCNMIGPMFANFLLYFVAMRHVYYGLYFRICVRCEGVGLGGAKAELPVRKSWVFWVC